MTNTLIDAMRTLPPLRRRQFLAGSAAAAALGVLGVPARALAQAEGTLRIASFTNPSSLDPATGGAGSDHVFLYSFYDTLVDWDFDSLAPEPGLATNWSYSDDTTLVLDLRQGVTFQDGTPFDADAVVFNLERNRTAQISNVKQDLENVEAVEKTGDHQVTLRLKQIDTALPLILSDRAGMMVSPAALGNDPEANVDRDPVGTGPWSFVSWADGDEIVGEAFAGHWRQSIPNVSQIVYVIIPERATALRAVQSGQADLAYQLDEQQKTLVERLPNLTVVEAPTLYIYQLYINAAKGPLQDKRVRKAMTMAIDRDAFVLATQSGIGEAAHMNLPSAHWAYAPDAEQYTQHDLDQAKALMDEAGFGNGLEIDFVGYTPQSYVQRQEVALAQLAKIGITGRFRNGTVADISGRFFGPEKNGEVMLSAWTGRPDPSLTYALLYSEDSYYNAGRVAPPEGFNEAMAKSRATTDQSERAVALATVQELVMDAALSIPLTVRFQVDALTDKVEGYRPNLLGKPKFRNVDLA
ncbi:ABC transporter substrate-binding protein [Acuticoccus sp.]|uniref:ABC transporter substrate-binding protein n=1 Tax=Acuticoccus sp. TaxID=1904378 RepID=UPI003B517288